MANTTNKFQDPRQFLTPMDEEHFHKKRRSAIKYLYDTHKNPIYVWEAYATCRKWKIEIPHWVLKYLDDCAENLSTIDQPDRASDEVYRALKFSSKKQRSPFVRFLLRPLRVLPNALCD